MKKKISKKRIQNKQQEAASVFSSEEEEVAHLEAKVAEQAPASGSQPANSPDLTFANMPLSSRTKEGLALSGLKTPTDIQAATLPHALAGKDILGAAKTGSGKTLSFVIPVLEKLFRERWGVTDGLGALIITPTRELALQIFEVLRGVGRKHQISAGLVTGGKKELEEEQDRVVGMNVLVATPGRLLQHLEQTPGFDASQLMMLVLDEADRILDMGFKQQLDSILTYLPPGGERQTLLFSATQTKSIKDLARLSLHRPEYLSVHATHSDATPSQLVQNYVVCRLHEKLDVLYSFIKSHLKNKIVVFLSSCSQVRFVFECLRGLQPGIPLMALHGKIKQDKRTLIYMDYARKPAACLFATDIAARGLDFPDVDWVVQVDAPEDRAMYIHRVGRTARYTSGGRALLLLMPQEEKVVMDELTGGSGTSNNSTKDKGKVVGTVNNIPLKKLSLNPKRTVQVSNRAAAMIVANPEYRSLAKKSFLSYLKSLSLLSNRKHVYRWSPSELDAYASSLGLHQTPELPVLKNGEDADNDVEDETKKKKNVNRSLDKLKAQIKAAKEEKKRLREEKLGKKAVKDTKADIASDDDEEDDDDVLLVVKSEEGKADLDQPVSDSTSLPSSESAAASIKATKRKKERALKISKDGETRKNSSRMLFDDEGGLIDPLASLTKALAAGGDSDSDDSDNEGGREGLSASIASRVRAAKSKLDSVRKEDDLREKERVKEKRLKLKRKKANQDDESDDDADGGAVCTLGGVVEDDYDSDSGNDSESGSDGDSDSEDEGLVKGGVVKGTKTAAKYSSSSDSDSDSMENSDDDSDVSDTEPKSKKSKKLSAAELRAQEALVLKMMK